MLLAICYLISDALYLKLAITCFLSLVVVHLVIFIVHSTTTCNIALYQYPSGPIKVSGGGGWVGGWFENAFL